MSAALAAAVGLAVLALGAMPSPQQIDDVAAIRAQRLAFNEAMAARQTERFGEFLAADVETVGGNGTALHGVAAYAEILQRLAQNPEFDTYVRTPDEIEIGGTGVIALEVGHWRGTWQRGDEETVASGRYMAQWRKTDDGWRIRAELFVGLECRGFACESLGLAPADQR